MLDYIARNWIVRDKGCWRVRLDIRRPIRNWHECNNYVTLQNKNVRINRSGRGILGYRFTSKYFRLFVYVFVLSSNESTSFLQVYLLFVIILIYILKYHQTQGNVCILWLHIVPLFRFFRGCYISFIWWDTETIGGINCVPQCRQMWPLYIFLYLSK